MNCGWEMKSLLVLLFLAAAVATLAEEPFEESIPIKTRQISILLALQSTLALQTPRYNGHPDETDSS